MIHHAPTLAQHVYKDGAEAGIYDPIKVHCCSDSDEANSHARFSQLEADVARQTFLYDAEGGPFDGMGRCTDAPTLQRAIEQGANLDHCKDVCNRLGLPVNRYGEGSTHLIYAELVETLAKHRFGVARTSSRLDWGDRMERLGEAEGMRRALYFMLPWSAVANGYRRIDEEIISTLSVVQSRLRLLQDKAN